MTLHRSHLALLNLLKPASFLIGTILVLQPMARAGDEDTTKVAKDVIQQPPAAPKFFFEAGAAGEFDYHATKFISDGSADFGTAGGSALPAKIQSRDFTSTHDIAAIDGRLQAGYIVNPFISLYSMFSYSHSSGDDSRRLGSVTDVNGAFGAVGGRYDLYGDIGKYQSYTGSLGARITLPRTILDFIHAPKFIFPYVNFSVGGKYLDKQQVRFYSGGVDAVDTSIDLYKDSWVLTSEGGLGYELRLARNFSINLDSNYGYDSKPERGDRDLSGSSTSSFQGINKGGDRFYSSFGLTAVFKF
jgi:hypothetical protein